MSILLPNPSICLVQGFGLRWPLHGAQHPRSGVVSRWCQAGPRARTSRPREALILQGAVGAVPHGPSSPRWRLLYVLLWPHSNITSYK